MKITRLFSLIFLCGIFFAAPIQAKEKIITTYISVHKSHTIYYEIIARDQDLLLRTSFDQFVKRNNGDIKKAEEDANIAFAFEFLNMKSTETDEIVDVAFRPQYPLTKNEFAEVYLIRDLMNGKFKIFVRINDKPLTLQEIFDYIVNQKNKELEI